jgi:hypothetical protein
MPAMFAVRMGITLRVRAWRVPIHEPRGGRPSGAAPRSAPARRFFQANARRPSTPNTTPQIKGGSPNERACPPISRFSAGPTSARMPRNPRTANPRRGNEIKMPIAPRASNRTARIRTATPLKSSRKIDPTWNPNALSAAKTRGPNDTVHLLRRQVQVEVRITGNAAAVRCSSLVRPACPQPRQSQGRGTSATLQTQRSQAAGTALRTK